MSRRRPAVRRDQRLAPSPRRLIARGVVRSKTMWIAAASALLGALTLYSEALQAMMPSGSAVAIGFAILMAALRAFTSEPLAAKGDRRQT